MELVAIGLDDASGGLARATLPLTGRPATVYLAHVVPAQSELEPFPSLGGWRSAYERRVEEELESIARPLRAEGSVKVECLLLHGDPFAELFGLVTRLQADLVAIGRAGAESAVGGAMGSTASRLLLGSRCSVLIQPPASPG